MKELIKKIEQNKAQYNLDTTTAKILALSLGNIIKFELLTEKDVLPKKGPVSKSWYNERTWILTVR